LKQQHSFKQDQFPTKIEVEVQMLNAHDWDFRAPNKSKQSNIDKKKSTQELE